MGCPNGARERSEKQSELENHRDMGPKGPNAHVVWSIWFP